MKNKNREENWRKLRLLELRQRCWLVRIMLVEFFNEVRSVFT